MPTREECRKIIFNLGIKLGVSPKLISERLLSDIDKSDMLEGNLSIDALECHIRVWMKFGMQDYAHGRPITLAMEKSCDLLK